MNINKRVIELEGPKADRAVSAFELERFHAGELSPERRQQIEAALASDEALAAELAELRARDAAFRVAMPFDRFLADHHARAASLSRWSALRSRLRELRFVLGGGLAAAAAASLALMLFTPADPGGAIVSEGQLAATAQNRLKGDARIGFFVKSDAGARWGSDGERLSPGDRIQLAVRDPEGARSMVIVGIDGRGEVSTYVARRLPTGTPKGVTEGSPRLLEQSLVLDDAVGAERFFVVYGKADDVDALAAAAENAAREVAQSSADLSSLARLPVTLSDVEQGSVHILKVAE